MIIAAPEVTRTAEQRAAVVRVTVPRTGMREAFGAAVHELLGVLAEQGVSPEGPLFAHHLTVDPVTFDFEVGVPVTSRVDETGRVREGQLPAAWVVRTVYRGAYDGLSDAWSRFSEWIELNGYTPAADAWERYLVDPGTEPDPAAWRTELNRPLAE